jgi:predicted RNA-binding Zn ribbon-like protein
MTKKGARDRGAIPRTAPGDLRILQDLLRTTPRGKRADLLKTPTELTRWLTAQGLLPTGTEVTAEEHRRGVELRDALLAHVRHGRRAVGRLEEVSRTTRFQIVVDDRGMPRYVPAAQGFERAFATLLAMHVEARRQGSWGRLKECPECGDVFYDISNNRIGKWCTDRCGERVRGAKARSRRKYSP